MNYENVEIYRTYLDYYFDTLPTAATSLIFNIAAIICH